MRIVLVIPTFNERGNVGRLIDELQQVLSAIYHDSHILVVDDHSPDGTAEVVRHSQAQWSNVHLLEGRKSGLGAAYIRGLKYAVNYLHADVVFEMDADFSHSPFDVPRLLNALEGGADLAIGSRYVRGGSIPKEWALHRRMSSRLGNVLARYLAGIYAVRDCTAGFRAIRADVLRRIDLRRFNVQGYAFQIALLHASVAMGAKVVEVPVDFRDRTVGESKLGIRDVIEFVRSALWIRFQSSRVFIKFCITGASGVAANLAIFSTLVTAGVNKYLASPVAIECSIVSNFLLNNYWTFRRRRLQGPVHARGLKFNVVSLLSLVISYLAFVGLSRVYPATAPWVIELISVVPATLVNYFLNAYWTFRDSTTAFGPSLGTRDDT